MSYVTVYNCDGPGCLASHDETDEPLALAGWFTLEFEEEAEQNYSHFCSVECLLEWAKELVPTRPGR